MRRLNLGSLCLAISVFAMPARLLAVWPPSTSLEEGAAASAEGARGEPLSTSLQPDVRASAVRLEQDERRLKELIQQLKEDEAALKKLSEKNKEGSPLQ